MYILNRVCISGIFGSSGSPVPKYWSSTPPPSPPGVIRSCSSRTTALSHELFPLSVACIVDLSKSTCRPPCACRKVNSSLNFVYCFVCQKLYKSIISEWFRLTKKNWKENIVDRFHIVFKRVNCMYKICKFRIVAVYEGDVGGMVVSLRSQLATRCFPSIPGLFEYIIGLCISEIQ